MTRFVLVGGGVATAATAAGLRDGGFDGDIVLVSDEPHVPYERPPLSKEVLAGTFGRTDFQVSPAQWYADNNISLKLGSRASAVDTAARRVSLADGESLSYDGLVLATGVRARTLPGFTGDRVHGLRSIADAERLASRLTAGSHLVVLGGGFIGCEVAAIAVAKGLKVTIFDPNPVPLARALGTDIGVVMLDIHREHGVDIRTGVLITGVTDTGDGLRLQTGDGEIVDCDELLIGVGSVPNVELAVEAGIEVDDGIVTDEYGRTSAPDVYAIGDVASRFHPVHRRRIRVEHHDTARRHGTNAARNLLGASEPFTEEHWFWSHQYEHNLQALGHASSDARSVIRGSVEERSFAVFSLVDGKIESIVALDRAADVMQTRKIMAVPHEVTEEQLADVGFQLKSLLPRRAGARKSEVRI